MQFDFEEDIARLMKRLKSQGTEDVAGILAGAVYDLVLALRGLENRLNALEQGDATSKR